MQARWRVGFIVAALLMISLAVARGTEQTEITEGPHDGIATKELRADGMAAWTVDSGGGESSGGGFALTAAIGQPDAGELSAGNTVMAGGLWAGSVELQILFYDGFESGDTTAWSSTTAPVVESP